MSEREAFDRILAALHEVALDHAHWSTATALIDEALRAHGSSMVFGDGRSEKDIQIYFTWYFVRGERRRDLERDYYKNYYHLDERVPRVRHLPDSQLFHVTDLYTEEELKTSAAYNEMLARGQERNSIVVRLDGPHGSRIIWVVNDPVDGNGWSSAQLDSIRRLLPHIRQAVLLQQALAGAGALGATLTELLDTTWLGIVQLDGRGRIVAANERAREVLRAGDGLFDEGGFLYAHTPEDLARALALDLPRWRGPRLRPRHRLAQKPGQRHVRRRRLRVPLGQLGRGNAGVRDHGAARRGVTSHRGIEGSKGATPPRQSPLVRTRGRLAMTHNRCHGQLCAREVFSPSQPLLRGWRAGAQV